MRLTIFGNEEAPLRRIEPTGPTTVLPLIEKFGGSCSR